MKRWVAKRKLISRVTFGLLVAVTCALTVGAVAVYSYGGNVYCPQDAGAEGTHGAYVDGLTGLFDFLAAPVNVEVDWDDGSWSSTNLTTSSSYEFHHTYGSGGLRHIKLYTEGADGGHCSEDNGQTSPTVFDVWVN
jgi:hypothetical protein